MPIKPENRARYPKDWPEIRARIVARAGNKCELCGVPNGMLIDRGKGVHCTVYRDPADGAIYSAIDSTKLGYRRPCEFHGSERLTRIVLTVAHWDNPDPADCRDENLKLACQKCHLAHDSYWNRIKAHFTRLKRKAMGDLFAGAYQ